VNGNGTVKVLLRGAHFDGNAKALSHFTAAFAQDVEADDFFVGKDRYELELRRVFGFFFFGESEG